MIEIDIKRAELRALEPRVMRRVLVRSRKKAASTSLRDMRSEASTRVRDRKKIKARMVRRALVQRRLRGSSLDQGDWGVDVRGDTTRVSDYSFRATKRRGVTAQINKGTRSRMPNAFVATMGSGHRGVFERRGTSRLPIDERLASRPVDALLHDGEAEGVRSRGVTSFNDTFERVLPMELEKVR